MNEKINQFIKPFIKKFLSLKQRNDFDYHNLSIEIPSVYPFSSVLEAIDYFKHLNVPALPVISIEKTVVGIITERDISHLIALQSLVGWSELVNYTVDSIYLSPPNIKTVNSSLEELVVEFTGKSIDLVVLVDEENKYSGYCITPASLISYTADSIRPRSIGGLATPIGVYLTDGYYNSGAGVPGLLLTGVLLSIVLNSIAIASFFILEPYNPSQTIVLIVQLVSFIVFLRLSPLVGLHAAEHQTIHAIERGMELTLENVKQQPKEHMRCGTNLMMLLFGLTLLVSIYYEYLPGLSFIEQTIFIILFSVILFSKWRKAGLFIQKFFTTASASDKQILNAINAGKQLLENYKNNTKPIRVSILRKIWNMGLLQILITFMLVSILILYIASILWPQKFVCDTIFLIS